MFVGAGVCYGGVGGAGVGVEKVGEAIGDVFLEEFEIFDFLVVGAVHGRELVAADAYAVEEGVLIISRRHGWLWLICEIPVMKILL